MTVRRAGIWDRQTGKQIAWVENDHDVYSLATERKFATVRENGNLYSLDGQFLNVHLENLDAGGSALVSDPDTLARFIELANGR
jgi:hypothetical protein